VARAGHDRRAIGDGSARYPIHEERLTVLLATVLDARNDERAAGRDLVLLTVHRDGANLRTAGRHGVVMGSVVGLHRSAAHVPEGLQPALDVDQLDVIGLRTREEALEAAAEGAGAPIHGPLADLFGRQAVVEPIDVLIGELDIHPIPHARIAP